MLLILITALMAQANEKCTADLFDMEGKTKLFTLETERVDNGDSMDYTAVYKDLNGEIAAQEKGHSEKGVFATYESSRPGFGDSGKTYVKGDRLVFDYIDHGKLSTGKVPFNPKTLYSGTLVPFLQNNIEKIKEGKEDLAFPYSVWFRKETITFKFKFEKEEAGLLIFSMAPTNFLYRSLVNPIFFTIEKAPPHKLVSIKGRTLPRQKVGGSWREVDAFTKYTCK
jgi:hypothetical protein